MIGGWFTAARCDKSPCGSAARCRGIGKGVFKPLESIDFFIERCTVMNDTLAWDVTGTFDPRECIDIAPETIYVDGVDVADPLASEVA